MHPRKSKFILRLIGMGLLAAACLAGTGNVVSQDAPRRIEVTAKRFGYSPSEIILKKGVPVVLALRSEDVAHGLKFKELNLVIEIRKGAVGELAFTPTTTGDFVGHCSHFCGAGHGSMTLMLHVTD